MKIWELSVLCWLCLGIVDTLNSVDKKSSPQLPPIHIMYMNLHLLLAHYFPCFHFIWCYLPWIELYIHNHSSPGKEILAWLQDCKEPDTRIKTLDQNESYIRLHLISIIYLTSKEFNAIHHSHTFTHFPHETHPCKSKLKVNHWQLCPISPLCLCIVPPPIVIIQLSCLHTPSVPSSKLQQAAQEMEKKIRALLSDRAIFHILTD